MTCSRSQASAASTSVASAATTALTPVGHQCPAPGCRTTLGPSNSVACDRCGQRCCLAHRFPDAHNCPAQAARSGGRAAGRGLAAALARQQQARAQPRPSPASTPSVASSRASASGSGRAGRRNLADEVRATAERRRQARSSSSSRAAEPRATASGAEQCPQCGARFAVVQDLIQHVEVAHGSGPARRGAQSPPNCTVC